MILTYVESVFNIFLFIILLLYNNTQTWSPVVTQNTDINMALDSSISYSCLHGTRQHHGPYTSACFPSTAWSLMAVQLMDVNMATCHSTGQEHQHCLWRKNRPQILIQSVPQRQLSPWISTWFQAWTCTWHSVVTWATDISMKPNCSRTMFWNMKKWTI